MKITLTKAGKNVRISFDPTETTQPDLLEDSANVEVTYQNLNNTVSVQVTGNNYFTTSDITASNQLYMDSGSGPVLINSKALFLTNYPLVFPNGGGGPVTTPNIDQVLAQGGSLTVNREINVDGNLFEIKDNTTGNSVIFNPSNNNNIGLKSINFFSPSNTVFEIKDAPSVQTLLSISTTTSQVILGDVSNHIGNCVFNINKASTEISAEISGNENGLKLDFNNRAFNFGDFAGIYNSTFIQIDDTANEMIFNNSQSSGFTEFRANQLSFIGANLFSLSGGASNVGHLVVYINNDPNPYFIKLEQ